MPYGKLVLILVCLLGMFSTSEARHRNRAVAVAHSSNERIVDHPSGCPHVRFCGCGVALRVFGKAIAKGGLAVAAAWRQFPRAAPAAGNVVVFGNRHVAYIEAVDANGNAVLYDPNSGGHKTRIHTRNISWAWVVNPRSGV